MFGAILHQYGLWFVVSLALALRAAFNIAQSPSTSPFFKARWIVVSPFAPVFGFAIWLFFGPRERR